NEVCAGWWRIDLAPVPTTLSSPTHEPMADLVPDHLGYGVPAGKANHFEIGPLPVGAWVVEATLEFADGQGGLIGQTTNFWNVVVR
ncbi:MAG TPA: hypothetical protein VGQ85_01205, partial [Candidatus Limnocylindrales bacterium]|nr:hypothetical protein [Candidatus Limnocylindrales bacterium]